MGVVNICLPLDLFFSDGLAIVFSISQKPHNSLQLSEGKQCCKYGLLYSDGFMLLLQDKLQGGTESCIRTGENFLEFFFLKEQPAPQKTLGNCRRFNKCILEDGTKEQSSRE